MTRVRNMALVTGGAGLLACLLGALFSTEQFYRSYLFAYVFWLGVPLGCLAILMIQHVTGGAWGLVIRRVLESGTRTIMSMSLLFLPVVLGIESLYVWANNDAVAADELLQHKALYLNVPFFLARAAIYFVAWIALAWVLSRWSKMQDDTGDRKLIDKFQKLSAGGLLVFVVTMTFASVDWIMSLEPHWFSTIYGGLLMAGQAVSAFCFVIAAVILLSRTGPLKKAVTPAILHDLGKLLYAFVMVWAYFALSQFMIIWSGNLPEEIPWYLRRLDGGWQYVGLSIILLHFVLPFLALLPVSVKKSASSMLRVTAMLFLMRFVDLYWTIAPVFNEGISVHWLDFAAVVGVGGIWVWLFMGQLVKMPLLPQQDPYMPESLVGGSHE